MRAQIAEHYDRVITTDTSKEQLELAQKHPKVKYALTPPILTDEELGSIVREEGSVDLVTVAMAVHWFDLETFYSQVKRILRKPGGVIAVWGYLNPSVIPVVDALSKDFFKSTIPYWNPKTKCLFNGYRTLPFPFDLVLENGEGRQGNPMETTEMKRQVSLDEYFGLFKSWSEVTTTREKGIELLIEKVLRMFREAWGDENKIYTCKYQVYLSASTAPRA